MATVTLRVYDLSRGMARQLSPALLGKQIDGIWHTGVLVFGQEYFFGGGIQRMAPELVVSRYGMQPVQEIALGTTAVTQVQLEQFLRQNNSRFTAATYDLLRHNCNNFSNEVAQFLLGVSIPQHILDLPNEALSTPMGAMLRPMIENMQNEMNTTGSQPFAIPFNDPALATTPSASAASVPTVATPAGVSRSLSMLSNAFTVSGQPTVGLDAMVQRIITLNQEPAHHVDGQAILSDADVSSLRELVTHVVDDRIALKLQDDRHPGDEQIAQCVQWWTNVEKLLAQGPSSSFLFPSLGVFRVLLLIPFKDKAIIDIKTVCFDHLLRISESNAATLSDSQMVMLLSVLLNGFANPVAKELVLVRAAQFLPLMFRALTESKHPDVRLVSAMLIGNCCRSLRMEEEVMVTAVICGCTEILDRMASELHQLHPHGAPGLESVIVGVGFLLQNFETARALSIELGLVDVLRRLHNAPSISTLHPLVSEVVALV